MPEPVQVSAYPTATPGPSSGYIMEESAFLQSVQKFYNADAQRISDLIDEEIKREAHARKEAERRMVKVMLLGQAESGKSTLQKQFSLKYSSQALENERPSWKPVVHFNIVKAVRMILDEAEYEFSRTEEDLLPEDERNRTEIAALRENLLPLVAIEASLASELNGGISVSGGRIGVFVRAGWQSLLSGRRGGPQQSQVVANLAARTLSSLSENIKALWNHPAVRSLHKLKLEESAPHFLDNITRISEPGYLPELDDILAVRLQTLGVTEHAYAINTGGRVYDWRLYDVGGARGQRSAWVPYFDDATAIIFLAPISAFDQYLDEDFRTNRIDDSLQLWNGICSNALLKKAHLVLLFNKTDLLQKKIQAGVKVRKYITSYGNRPNTFEAVSEYFRSHFLQIHRKKDLAKRPLYTHYTSMLDIKDTQRIIAHVGEAIISEYIKQTGLV